MTTTAKFPTALLTLANLGGEMANFPEATLSGAHNAAVTTITLTAAVPAAWPTTGGWVTIDSEIIQYTGVSGSTLTVCTRASQSTTAATHADQAKVGLYLTAAQWNQVVADLIAVETQALVGPSTNLVLNSDFSRRTVFGLAMPEVFADTSGDTAITGALGSVAANVLTAGGTGTWRAGVGPSDTAFWRDCRMSASFKMVATGAIVYRVGKYIDANNELTVEWNNGNFNIIKNIAGTPTTVATVAQAGTLNRWYWLEIEFQGTTVIGKMYDTGGTVPGVTKASSTLLQTLSGTVSDSAVTTGRLAIISSSGTASQWGGIATGNGGVYVETWLPESWTVTHGGTLGGQALGYDEAADSGPGTVAGTPYAQNALRAYIPAASRAIFITQTTRDGSTALSTAYAGSAYLKTSGLGGSGTLGRFLVKTVASDGSSSSANLMLTLIDGGATSWTRKTEVATTGASTPRRFVYSIDINPAVTATGTVWIHLGQVEQGSAVTAWRNAPADDAPIVWELTASGAAMTTTSGTEADANARDLAANFFFPWDCSVVVEWNGVWTNSGTNQNLAFVTGGLYEITDRIASAGANQTFFYTHRKQYSAGKNRIAAQFATGAGTLTLENTNYISRFRITAYRGK